MQTGFDPNSRVLGTPVTAPMNSARAAAVQTSFAQTVFDNAQQGIESINEKASAYPRHYTMLQGMNLTNVPQGGLSRTPAHIVIGTDGEANVRMDTLFTIPEEDRRMTVMPEGPVAVDVFRTPDGKTRSARGFSTVKRWQQEAQAGQGRMLAARASQLATLDSGDDDDDDDHDEDGGYRRSLAATAPPPPPRVVYVQVQGPGAGLGPGAAPEPECFQDVTVSVATQQFTEFMTNVGRVMSGKMTSAQFHQAFMARGQWLAVLLFIMTLLFVVFFIATIALATRSKGSGEPGQATNEAYVGKSALQPAQASGARFR
jgi:hypothetical protein